MKLLFSGLLIFIGLLFGPHTVQAAALLLDPTSASPFVGKTFQVNLGVQDTDEYMNALSSTISFTPDVLELVSISKTGSILSMWIHEPTFSNQTGKAELEGVVFNPGYKGSFGKIATFTFRAKMSGPAKISVSAGSVLANDGRGTEVLRTLGSTDVLISSAKVPEGEDTSSPVQAASLAPAAPKIVSKTHPVSSGWYKNTSPEFGWELPEGITAVRLQYDTNPKATPSITYTSPVNSKKIDNIDDGTYYFHVQLKNQYGWGDISHYKFQIDTVPPEQFTITFPNGAVSDEPRPVILLTTSDKGSGIDYYDIKIDNNDFVRVLPNQVVNNQYTLPSSSPGKKSILVKVVDRAGNETASFAEYEVTSILPPVIDSYTTTLKSGELFRVSGTTYPNSKVTIVTKSNRGFEVSEYSTSDASGKFVFLSSRNLITGANTFKAQVTDSRGAVSVFTPEYTFAVEVRALFKIGAIIIDYLTIVVLLGLLLTGLATLCFYLITHYKKLRKKLKKDIDSVDKTVHEQFEKLRLDIEKQLKSLEKVRNKRDLTKEEEKIITTLKKYVKESEQQITKKIIDVEKDI